MGRTSKNQRTAHLNMRSIGSYFQSTSGSSSSSFVISNSNTRLISSYFQRHPGPSAELESSIPDRAERHTPEDKDVEQSEVAADTSLEDDLDPSMSFEMSPPHNPFSPGDNEDLNDTYYDASDSLNPSSPGKSSIKSEAGEASKHNEPISTDLDSVDSLGLMTFNSQVSGESLRRLALSPRKAKWKGMTPGSMPSKPSLTFSEKLAEEMGTSLELMDSNSKLKPLELENIKNSPFTKDIVEGSDSGSEADWNDTNILVAAEIDAIAPQLTSSGQEMETNDSNPNLGPLGSDDDIPTLKQFSNKIGPMVLEESDSELDDDLFSGNLSPATPTPSTGTPATTDATPIEDETESKLDMKLSDIDAELEDIPLQRATGRVVHAQTSAKSGRTLRSSVAKPALIPAISPKLTSKTPKSTQAKKHFFSLDVLLKEKKRRDEIGYDIKTASANTTLDDNLIEEFDEAEDEEVISGPTMIPKGVLSEEQEGALTEIIEENSSEIVEDFIEFFVHWPQEFVIPSLELELEGADASDHVVQKVLECTKTETERRHFLMSPYLMIISATPWTMPRSLFKWLLLVTATEQHQPVTLSVFALLQRILTQRTSVHGIDHQDLIRVFGMYGANDKCLTQDWRATPVTKETRNQRLILPETKSFPRQNLKSIIKLVNITATLNPQFYDFVEIQKIMNLLLRMTTDPIIGDIKSLLGSTMVALLDIIPESDWDSKRQQLCESIIFTLGTSLPFILLVLNQLPSLSLRITLLRRSIALAYLQQPPIPPGGTAPNLDELHRALFIDKGFLVGPETNYKDLGRRIKVLGYCLDDEQMIAGYGRSALEPLLKKLRRMHGRIVDVRAAFMERTLTKDIIQRLYMRIYYAGIHRQMVKQSTINFNSIQTKVQTNGQAPPTTNIANLRSIPELAAPVTNDLAADVEQSDSKVDD
ncbi:hypothetical protein BX616_008349 [Lobosporangium transversale]|uniref:Uncharacterized protein n=1 Tax=Lobosporangium transversale TaxID=64571 RepID=A0A1Y2GNH8_9FUNG|nr:hypothetical protein BCR41DRAFT_386752 [Lobosporangium transversale]KAF9918504.1 hypothetical protein BX616_008349 [Lobosporangium transversale]ORZ14907.1 hypothetical protein BCR41DRAFT_386752 [Lobosporangium transversale]|eukprot:XP_021881039.1 hypothetical protein BCR41DRAFT_386752 [Lobosporangium transversale]